MRVTFPSIDTFLNDLAKEAEAGHVWHKQVRARIDLTPEQVEEISFRVKVTLTALIDIEEEQYIMEAEIDCGSDDPDNRKDKLAGTNQAAEYMKKLMTMAHENGLEVRSGKVEAF